MKRMLQKIFGDRVSRLTKRLDPIVVSVKEWADSYRDLRDEDFPKKTEEFIERIGRGETLDEILPEAYGLVYETCRRLVGRTWKVVGHDVNWDMVPFDVQIAGAVVLHEGSIAEMATGEGKTLVATMPLYLNALAKKGVHLVTVNDYLAKRDSEWMGEIYCFLGLTAGFLQNEDTPERKREVYQCDIVYGTNNEFGFDYLRDNMKITLDQKVQRGHFYAIVDEVDSVLVDEARTPLIISGPVSGSSHTQNYSYLRSKVEGLVTKQKRMVNELMSEVERTVKSDGAEEDDDLGIKLLLARRGDPKNKKYMKIKKEPGLEKLMLRSEADFMREKKLHELDSELYFVVDEKSNTIDITDKGRDNLSPEDQELFVLPDLSLQIKEIDSDDSLSFEEKIAKKDRAYRRYAEKSDIIHNFSQLLKAYTLFEKDVEYVVQDDRVVIVDEFTGRLMPGRRFSDGLHQALEAKEKVKIEGETQTLATITLQNYFRMYEKLAGMTGTAETEEEEFHKIYKLNVHVIPTNRPVRRVDYDDQIFRTKREKYNAIVQEIKRLHANGLPILVGTVSVEVSETLSRMLGREGIKHNVLNAKQHQSEAEVVAYAGQVGAVTIATNMAGRGTDIKLARDVVKCERCCILCETPDDCGNCPNPEKRSGCEEDVPCGLQIIGTERHESRRIDRQLRGRSGRQGDPGASRFLISLEDDLMRLFGSERISAVMDKLGVEDGELITHPFITRAIGNAQKRVEMYNFGIRKRLLEYDDVMNKQREVIYGRRDRILFESDLEPVLSGLIGEVVEDIVEKYAPRSLPPDEWDFDNARGDLEGLMLVPFDMPEIQEDEIADLDIVVDSFKARGLEAFEMRKTTIPEEIKTDFMRMIMLQSIDDKWMDHLYELDYLREGIYLRSYAQKDPLIEYKQEAFQMFSDMLAEIDKSILWALFRARFRIDEKDRRREDKGAGVAVHQVASAYSAPKAAATPQSPAGGQRAAVGTEGKRKPVRSGEKVGRNDPCPCGSGKKYKKCCGKNVS
jgi:preprotein translocase subunit SecA